MSQKKIKQKTKTLFLRKAKVIPLFKKGYLNKKSHGKRLFSKESTTNNDFMSIENNYI